VVISQRQLPVLSVKPVAAHIVTPGRADTVASPVTEGADNLVQKRVVRVDSAPLAHSHMVRRIEAGGSDVPHGSREFLHAVDGVTASQGIAVVLHQPQVVFVTKCLHSTQIKGISQGVGNHDRLAFLRVSRFQLAHVDIVLGNRHIHKHRHRPILNHRRHRGWESGRHRDDLVPPFHLTLSK